MEPHKQRLSSMLKQPTTENPTGAGKKPALRVTFDSRLKLEFHGSKVTSDAGLLAYRELDEALGLTDLGDDLLNDWRTGKNTQHSLVALMRQSIFRPMLNLCRFQQKLFAFAESIFVNNRPSLF